MPDCPARWHDYSDYSNGHCLRGCVAGLRAVKHYRAGLKKRKTRAADLVP